MFRIEVKTAVQAPIELCFDLSRSHQLHSFATGFASVNGIIKPKMGLLEPGDLVNWKHNYFGLVQKVTSKVTEFRSPELFVQEMVSGSFNHFRHEHHFKHLAGFTHITDIVEFEPGGLLGKTISKSLLEKNIETEVKRKGFMLKSNAETHRWPLILGASYPAQVR